MGQMTQCDEGHYYDKAVNRSCPHCGLNKTVAARVSDDSTSAAEDDPEEEKTIRAGSNDRKKSKGDHRDGRRDGVTEAIWRSELGIDPVVGWLVCSYGENLGRDYRICSGRNVIGRDPSSQICLRGDESISRVNHAKIFYDTKDTSFHMTEGEGRSGVYVNGKVVLQPTRLEAYDVLEIGETKLIFVPLCGPKFRWKEKKREKRDEKSRKGKRPDSEDDDDDDDDDDRDGDVTVAN